MNELYRKTVGGYKLFADRAVCDEDGNNIKTTKQNHNIAESTPVATAMNLLATTSSGDIVRTNLEFNTALTTKFLSQSGAWLTVDSDSWKKYSVDHGCTGDDSSIYIGTNNSALGKSILFGVGNSTSGVSGIKNHATLIGFDNTSTSDIEYFVRDIDNVSTNVQCNSILMGSMNTSEHHNAILIGMLNNALEPISAADKTINTHDDGFMMAVGYGNTVGRNYDFAYGYKSVANGGENIAFQHSSAIGYRNIAFVDSMVNGTGNIGIMESIMNVELSGSYQDTYALTHNTLINAVLASSDRIPSGYGLHHNLLMSVTASMYGSRGAVGNIIYGGRNRTDDSYMYNPVTLNTSSAAVTGNIVLGNMTSGTTISATAGIRNNTIVNPEYMSITGQDAVAVNTFINSTVSLSNSNIVMYNFMHCSTISGTVGPLTNNVLFGNSTIESSFYDQSIGVYKNVLFSNSMLTHTNNKRVWNSGQNQPTGENFLVGTKAEDILSCVSFGDRSSGTSTYASPQLINCLRVFNFGDNTISRTLQSAVFGTENQISCGRRIFISGDENALSGLSSIPSGTDYGWIGYANIFGSKNKLYAYQSSSVERVMMRGDGNEVYTGCYDLTMFGNYNKVGIGSSPSYTTISTIDAFNQAINANVLSRVRTTTAMPMPGVTEVKTAGYTFYRSWYRYYANGMVFETGTPSTYYSLTGSEFVSRYLAGTLTNNAYYYISADYTLTAGQTVYYGERTNTSDYYIVGNGHAYKDSATYWNSRNFVTGDKNLIYCGINDCVVFGNDNLISQSMGNYSHDVILGNNNTINNGSGSVIIGAGSTTTGHMAMAIGNQLVARQWQTVFGKYNSPIDGPDRTKDPTTEPDKALFIIGNGYSETDKTAWRNESLIHRSNAMVVYADGTVNAHDFVSDNELTLDGQNGVSVTEDLVNSKVVISLDSATADIINFLKSKPAQGTYAIQSTDGVLSWVAIGLV